MFHLLPEKCSQVPLVILIFKLHLLQGSTCDIRVKNGSVFEGIFKTLSSRVRLLLLTFNAHRNKQCETSYSGNVAFNFHLFRDKSDQIIFPC